MPDKYHIHCAHCQYNENGRSFEFVRLMYSRYLAFKCPKCGKHFNYDFVNRLVLREDQSPVPTVMSGR